MRHLEKKEFWKGKKENKIKAGRKARGRQREEEE